MDLWTRNTRVIPDAYLGGGGTWEFSNHADGSGEIKVSGSPISLIQGFICETLSEMQFHLSTFFRARNG